MSTPGLDCDTCQGELTLNAVGMHRPAWCMLDIVPLWMGGAVRGSDVLIPGVEGVIAYRRRFTVTQHSLPMLIAGEVDPTGAVVAAGPWVGLQGNIDYLRASVIDPTNVGDGTIPGSIVMPDGTVRTADVHVLGLALGRRGIGVHKRWRGVGQLATLELSIPAGRFV